MALTIAITRVTAGAVAQQPCTFVATITNGGASAVTLQELNVSEVTKTGARIGQPTWQTPGQPVASSYPTINAAAAVSYSFQVIPMSPDYPGPSPQNPGGGAQAAGAGPAVNTQLVLQVQSKDSDNLLATAQITVPVASTFDVFPRPEGGALDLRQGSNLINFPGFF